jgi:hypothetical protein
MITVNASRPKDRVGTAFGNASLGPSQQAGGAPACAARLEAAAGRPRLW